MQKLTLILIHSNHSLPLLHLLSVIFSIDCSLTLNQRIKFTNIPEEESSINVELPSLLNIASSISKKQLKNSNKHYYTHYQLSYRLFSNIKILNHQYFISTRTIIALKDKILGNTQSNNTRQIIMHILKYLNIFTKNFALLFFIQFLLLPQTIKLQIYSQLSFYLLLIYNRLQNNHYQNKKFNSLIKEYKLKCLKITNKKIFINNKFVFRLGCRQIKFDINQFRQCYGIQINLMRTRCLYQINLKV